MFKKLFFSSPSSYSFSAKMFSYAMESADVVMNVVEKGVEQVTLFSIHFFSRINRFSLNLIKKKARCRVSLRDSSSVFVPVNKKLGLDFSNDSKVGF